MGVIERDFGAGGLWYVVAVHYPTALAAKRAWERVNSKLNMRTGDEGIGLMRLSSTAGSGADTGAPPHIHPVVAVTLDETTARKAERLLASGTGWAPNRDFIDAMIFRRARVVLAQERRGETGRIVIRRPDGRGARLDPRGQLYEPEPGQG